MSSKHVITGSAIFMAIFLIGTTITTQPMFSPHSTALLLLEKDLIVLQAVHLMLKPDNVKPHQFVHKAQPSKTESVKPVMPVHKAQRYRTESV